MDAIKLLNLIGLAFGFIGAVLMFLDGWRLASMFTGSSFSLGYGKNYNTPFWRWCGRVGIGLVALGFLCLFAAELFVDCYGDILKNG